MQNKESKKVMQEEGVRVTLERKLWSRMMKAKMVAEIAVKSQLNSVTDQ
jgi:hypothetical protein